MGFGEGLVSEQLAKFLVGGLVGYLWERVYAPSLPGSLPGVPFRPIYGVGAVLASDNFSSNVLTSMAAERLGNSKKKHWSYDKADALVLDEDIDLRNSVAFGVAMSAFNDAWKKASGEG